MFGAIGGQTTRLKTPSAGISSRVPSAGILKKRDDEGFDYADISGLRFWLETKNDQYLFMDVPPTIVAQQDRVQNIIMLQANGPDQPRYQAAPIVFDEHDGTTFDIFSGNQFLESDTGTGIPTDATSGSVIYAGFVIPLTDGEWVWSCSYTALLDVFMGIKTYEVSPGSFRFAFHYNKFGTTPVVMYGNTDISAGGVYIIEITSSGTNYTMRVNGVAQTLTLVSGVVAGDWFGDMLVRNKICVNQLITGAGNQQGAFASMGLLLVYDGPLGGDRFDRVYELLNESFPEAA